MEQLLSADPSTRPSAKEVLQHEFLRQPYEVFCFFFGVFSDQEKKNHINLKGFPWISLKMSGNFE